MTKLYTNSVVEMRVENVGSVDDDVPGAGRSRDGGGKGSGMGSSSPPSLDLPSPRTLLSLDSHIL